MPVGFVFDSERIGRLRRHPQTLAGVLDVRPPDGRERKIRSADDWRVRGYWIESRVIDGDGAPTGERLRSKATVVVKDPLTGERKPTRAVLTVVAWEDVVVFGDEPLGRYRALAAADAPVCGYVTLEGLRGAWRKEHPSAALARLYHFMLGDRRDRVIWLTSTRAMRWAPGKKGGAPLGDYTSSPSKSIDPDAPLLTDVELEPLTMAARQRDAARRRARQTTLASASLAARVARIETGEAALIARRELAVIGQKVTRTEQRLAVPRSG